MRNTLIILLSGAVLAVGACNKHEPTTADNGASDLNIATDNMSVDNGAMANSAAASPLSAQGFANAAAASDRFEIESSKLAATQASSSAVKKFAEKMIAAHTESTAKLKTTASGLSTPVTPDDTLSADQQAKLDSLKGLNGAGFDSAYASAQVDAHQAALDGLKNYGASGDTPEFKTFANGLVPTVTAHLNMAKGLK